MKLVRIKINNRVDRVFNFDDQPTQYNNHYIIRNGNYGEPRELFSVEEGAVIIDGRSVVPLAINKIEKADASNTLIVTLGKKKTDKNVSLEFVEYIAARREFVCIMNKPESSDTWEVKFKLDGSDSCISIFLHFASTIYDAIIDFGSEASQACWYKDGNKRDINITKSINSLSNGGTTSYENHVQYESDTLYKSIYYFKKNIGTEELKPWPDYSSDLLKFLVPTTEEVKDLYKDYFQLPNSKLAQFDIARLARMTVTADGEDVSLNELGIERTLMNNIVMQTLLSIQSSSKSNKDGVYVVLNILMPNVYPIHLTSQKLNQLAEDIHGLITNDLTKEKFKNIKAVELRSVSESDASLLGYAQSIQNNKKALKSGYYLIMDAGKGTLDFSLVEVSEERAYVNKSRAGIVGAGNAITYGLIIGLVNDYLSEMASGYVEKSDSERQKMIRLFVFNNILGGKKTDEEGIAIDVAKLQKFNQAVERYKKVYNGLYEFRKAPRIMTEEDRERSEDFSKLTLKDFTDWINALSDNSEMLTKESCGYVSIEIENIVSEAIRKMDNVVNCLQQTDKSISTVKYVIFTGRGFLMKEFRDVMRKYLILNHIVVENETIEVTPLEHMKSGCLEINQLLTGGQYDASPSHQSIGLLRNIDDRSEDSSHIDAISKNKKTHDEAPDKQHRGLSFDPIRETRFDGNLEKEGIVIKGITAHSSISLGGWLYTIDTNFKGRKCTVYFDGIHYWITAKDVDSQRLDGAAAQNRYSSSLCFESLFPNVIINSFNDVKIPQKENEPIIIQSMQSDEIEDEEEVDTHSPSEDVEKPQDELDKGTLLNRVWGWIRGE